MKTVAIQLWAGQVRGSSVNPPTVVVRVSRTAAPAPPALDLRSAFMQAYPTFAVACRAVDEPGVALVAIDERTGAAAGMTCVRAHVDRPVCAILGRHDRCDLYLDGNDRLALRQLALIVSPVQTWRRGRSDVSFRLFDLRSADGMIDERGRTLRGLRSEGPTFVRCAGYLVLALPLGDATDWPASAADAWAYLPERVYFDECAQPAAGSVVAPRPMRDPNMTPIVRLAGPSEIGALLAIRDDVAGRLVIDGPPGQGTGTVSIGHQALRDGVLLGRYARCDAAGLATDASLSRVHLLLVRVDDRLLAIDTASTNGTRVRGGTNARLVELTDGAELELGCDTRMRWECNS